MSASDDTTDVVAEARALASHIESFDSTSGDATTMRALLARIDNLETELATVRVLHYEWCESCNECDMVWPCRTAKALLGNKQ